MMPTVRPQLRGNYILVDGKPIEEPDVLKWVEWMVEADMTDALRIAHTVLGPPANCRVSTVFLARGTASFRRDVPLLFETMIFGGGFDFYQQRYATVEEARRGHEEIVESVRRGEHP